MNFDDELTKAARTLHREWDSPELWPAIAKGIAEAESEQHHATHYRPWMAWAAAAVVILATTVTLLVMRDSLVRERPTGQPARAGERLLSDEALSEVEQAEAQYIAAIEGLATKATAASNASRSPVLAHLRERLLVIDAAIADCRAELERNRFNTHLRRQLLAMYQEKRQTLEQILKQEQHAS